MSAFWGLCFLDLKRSFLVKCIPDRSLCLLSSLSTHEAASCKASKSDTCKQQDYSLCSCRESWFIPTATQVRLSDIGNKRIGYNTYCSSPNVSFYSWSSMCRSAEASFVRATPQWEFGRKAVQASAGFNISLLSRDACNLFARKFGDDTASEVRI